MTDSSSKKIAGVILAGGLARRMGGGDKSLLKLGNRPLLDQVIERAGSQVDTLVLNANGDPTRFAAYGLPVAADVVPDFAGPLAGILTGMHWVRDNAPECEWLVSFASDTPFFPEDLVARMLQQATAENAPLACAVSDGRNHPVFGLWSVSLIDDLHKAVVDEEMRKILRWTDRYKCSQV
ncbi:MAG: molybdenum cofactor guanylyltransferase MobA, partial [Pseudomonadales bacterium]